MQDSNFSEKEIQDMFVSLIEKPNQKKEEAKVEEKPSKETRTGQYKIGKKSSSRVFVSKHGYGIPKKKQSTKGVSLFGVNFKRGN